MRHNLAGWGLGHDACLGPYFAFNVTFPW